MERRLVVKKKKANPLHRLAAERAQEQGRVQRPHFVLAPAHARVETGIEAIGGSERARSHSVNEAGKFYEPGKMNVRMHALLVRAIATVIGRWIANPERMTN